MTAAGHASTTSRPCSRTARSWCVTVSTSAPRRRTRTRRTELAGPLGVRLDRDEAERALLGVVRREPDQQDVGRKLGGQVVQRPWQERYGLGIAVPIRVGW